jgi:hypothetical protein
MSRKCPLDFHVVDHFGIKFAWAAAAGNNQLQELVNCLVRRLRVALHPLLDPRLVMAFAFENKVKSHISLTFGDLLAFSAAEYGSSSTCGTTNFGAGGFFFGDGWSVAFFLLGWPGGE